MMTGLFLGLCGTLAIVVPAMGGESPGRSDAARTESRRDSAAAATLESPRALLGSSLAAGACKSLATFISSAVPALQKDGCTGCHSEPSGSAKRALDLSGVGTNNTSACMQALAKVNVANRPQSVLIQAPAGSGTHAGGKVDDRQAFSAAMLGWINNE